MSAKKRSFTLWFWFICWNFCCVFYSRGCTFWWYRLCPDLQHIKHTLSVLSSFSSPKFSVWGPYQQCSHLTTGSLLWHCWQYWRGGQAWDWTHVLANPIVLAVLFWGPSWYCSRLFLSLLKELLGFQGLKLGQPHARFTCSAICPAPYFSLLNKFK